MLMVYLQIILNITDKNGKPALDLGNFPFIWCELFYRIYRTYYQNLI